MASSTTGRIVDTNVPKTANRGRDTAAIPPAEVKCILACIEAVTKVVSNFSLVLDAGDEIFTEYRRQLHLSGLPGIGDAFVKWVHENRYLLPDESRVAITPNGDSYDEFPAHDGLTSFDRSDRKFVAVANAHPEKPTILQATDSKWIGWESPLAECGISVEFLCRELAEALYRQKVGEKYDRDTLTCSLRKRQQMSATFPHPRRGFSLLSQAVHGLVA